MAIFLSSGVFPLNHDQYTKSESTLPTWHLRVSDPSNLGGKAFYMRFFPVEDLFGHKQRK